ncbi:RimK family alpha-L-glutamate ligase [Salinicola sp. DM10]|uniref:ATP-grasp domain-containing protein n=1 Tax=Salinicola sp. DM10 TaxID=2815721 RepID=UPI001A8F05A6|nr:hypothetical protein [Salinicola sp. DM10]MCE3027076.1 hypothetical protein [Salinicola sp. DM10]
MRLITFDVSRTLGMPNVRYIKPERMFDHLDEIQAADWLLFPSYWQVNVLLHALHKRIFPSPATYYLGHDKVEQTRAMRAAFPQHIPPTAIQANTPYGIDAVEAEIGYPMILKEIRSARGNGVHLVERRRELERFAADNPVLYAQPRLPIDRDLRIVLVGDRILASYWRVTPLGGYRANVAQGGRIDHEDIPEAAVALVKRVAAAFQIDHGGFDVAMLGETPILFEFNRLFGTQGIADAGRVTGAAMLDWLGRRELGLTAPVPEAAELPPAWEPPTETACEPRP